MVLAARGKGECLAVALTTLRILKLKWKNLKKEVKTNMSYAEKRFEMYEALAEQFGVPVQQFVQNIHKKACKTYINGILASDEDIAELERRLRLGSEMATGRMCGDCIYYETI